MSLFNIYINTPDLEHLIEKTVFSLAWFARVKVKLNRNSFNILKMLIKTGV